MIKKRKKKTPNKPVEQKQESKGRIMNVFSEFYELKIAVSIVICIILYLYEIIWYLIFLYDFVNRLII